MSASAHSRLTSALWATTFVLSFGRSPSAGWTRNGDRWVHKYAAHYPEWAVVNWDAPKSDVDWTLPGWSQLPNGSYLDSVLGDISETEPMVYQNERTFKTFYAGLVKKVSELWRDYVPQLNPLLREIAEGHANQETYAAAHAKVHAFPVDFIEAVLRVVKAPRILTEPTTSMHLADVDEILSTAGEIFRLYASPQDSSIHPPARLLFIAAGQIYDWYHHNDAYKYPAWLKQGLQDILPDDAPCTNYGFVRPPLLDNEGWVASDVSVVAFVRRFFPDIDVHVLDPCRNLAALKDARFLDSFDVIVNDHVNPVGENLKVDKRFAPIGFKAFDEALRHSQAYVYNHAWITGVDTNKSQVPLTMRAHGVPALDTIAVWIDHRDTRAEIAIATSLVESAIEKGWEKIFIKPCQSAYMRNLQLIITHASAAQARLRETQKLARFLVEMRGAGVPGVAAQKFLSTVEENWEIRLYFFGDQFRTAIANKVDGGGALAFADGGRHSFFHWDWFDFSGGALNSTELGLFTNLLPLAKRARQAMTDGAVGKGRLPATVHHYPLTRVDLACCLEHNDFGAEQAGGWFVNEIEYFPDLLQDHFHRQVVNEYVWAELDFSSNARMVTTIERAAAAWYPTVEHFGLELARLIKAAVSSRTRPRFDHGGEL